MKALRQERAIPAVGATLRPVWLGCSDGGWRAGGNRPRRAFCSPRTLSVERSSGAIPSAGQWSPPAGMWLKGLSCLGLVVAGGERMPQLIQDPTGPIPHIPVGGGAGKTPRGPFAVGGGLPTAGQAWSVLASRLLDRVSLAGSKLKGVRQREGQQSSRPESLHCSTPRSVSISFRVNPKASPWQ